MNRPTFEMSIDTRMIYDHLSKAEIGDTVNFTALSEAIGQRVEGATPSVQSALRRLQNLDGRIFANVRGVGYQRLSDNEIVKTSESSRDLIRRHAAKSVRRLSCVVDFDGLPNDLKIKHNAGMSMFGAIANMLKPSSVRALENEVAKAQASLPLAKTLEAFKG